MERSTCPNSLESSKSPFLVMRYGSAIQWLASLSFKDLTGSLLINAGGSILATGRSMPTFSVNFLNYRFMFYIVFLWQGFV